MPVPGVEAPPSAGSDAAKDAPACPPGSKVPCPATPAPVLEIVDKKSGKVVSGGALKVIVGQKVTLEARTKPAGGALSAIQWTIPGETVKSYTQSAAKAERKDLAPMDLQAATVEFYWIKGGNNDVEVRATVSGTALTAKVAVEVLAPTDVSATSKTGAVAASIPGFPGSGLELHYGTNVTAGIAWTLKAKAPAGGAGELAGVQIANPPHTRTKNNGDVESRKPGGFRLDNSLPYAPAVPVAAGASATWASDDTPGIPLSRAYKSVTAKFDARLFFMYKPAGADSIWVTLSRLDWDWAATTTRTVTPGVVDNVWGAPTGVSATANPSGTASTELPVWTANLRGLDFTP